MGRRVEEVVWVLNSFVQTERARQKVEADGFFVVRQYKEDTLFDALKLNKVEVWYVSPKKDKREVVIRTQYLSNQSEMKWLVLDAEEVIDINLHKLLLGGVFEFIRNEETYNKYILGGYETGKT